MQQLVGEGWHTSVQRLTPPHPITSMEWELLETDCGGGGTCRKSTVISNSHLQFGHQWSYQHHFECFMYSSSSVPGSICSHFFVVSSWNCSSSCPGWSGHHVVNFPIWGFSIYKTAHRIWLRILSTALEKELIVLTMLNDYKIII